MDVLTPAQLAIQAIIEQRQIHYLFHFTPTRNLQSIRKHGLLPRDQLPEKAEITDCSRWDGHLDSVCLSVSWFNEELLRTKEKHHFLTVLAIDPRVLYWKECAFFPHNAATKCYRSRAFADFMGAERFEALFAAEVTYQKSWQPETTIARSPELEPDEPTSNQAEVLCRERIEPEWIFGQIDRKRNVLKLWR